MIDHKQLSPLLMWDKIGILELENQDLRERLNAICTFLSMRYDDDRPWIAGSGMVENNNEYCDISGVKLGAYKSKVKCSHPSPNNPTPSSTLKLCEKCNSLQLFNDEPEYCNVSGVRLGKREECEHESDGQTRTTCITGLKHTKCIKCGEFYR